MLNSAPGATVIKVFKITINPPRVPSMAQIVFSLIGHQNLLKKNPREKVYLTHVNLFASIF
jgi:hypothetical protein